MSSGTTSHHPVSARGTIGNEEDEADQEEQEAEPDDAGRAPLAHPLAHDRGDGEHRQRERRQGQAGQECAVLEHHLQVERDDDHRAAERDLLEAAAR